MKNLVVHFKSWLVSLTLLLASLVASANENVIDIINKSNLASYYQGVDGRAQARMIIVDASGKKQMRQFTILRKDQADLGDQNMLVFFSKPADVNGTVFRVTKKVQSDDDRWLYLPALDLVKRISAGDKRTSFVGAHFYYEDVSGRNPAEDDFSIMSQDNSNYVIKATPKDPNSVEYSYYQVTIDKQSYLPMLVNYYDVNNKAIREMKVIKVETVQGFPTVTHARITNLADGSFTEMQFRNVQYNIGLPDDVFSERSLRNTPKAWLN